MSREQLWEVSVEYRRLALLSISSHLHHAFSSSRLQLMMTGEEVEHLNVRCISEVHMCTGRVACLSPEKFWMNFPPLAHLKA